MRNPKNQKNTQQLQPNKTCVCGACVPKKPKPPLGTRRLKVYYKYLGSSLAPVILLQGGWLRSSGFDIGDSVLVTVERKRLVIDFENEADED